MPNPKEQIDEAIAALPKATPGPWIKSQNEALIHAPEGGALNYIALIGDTGNDFGNGLDDIFITPEVLANMSLIAAAPALARRVVELDAENAALRSLVRRMREALTGNSLWPAEVDALCAEADKAIGVDERLQGGERSER